MPTTRPLPLRILVVDDHEDTALAVAALLRRAGHHVLTAAGFGDALAVAAGVNSIDVLVSDVTLPDGSGCDLLPLLRQRRAGGVAAAIAITGHADDEWGERCRRAGFEKVLVKPVPLGVLLEAVTEVASTPASDDNPLLAKE